MYRIYFSFPGSPYNFDRFKNVDSILKVKRYKVYASRLNYQMWYTKLP